MIRGYECIDHQGSVPYDKQVVEPGGELNESFQKLCD